MTGSLADALALDCEIQADAIIHTIELFKPGKLASVSFTLGVGLFADGLESGDTTRWTLKWARRPERVDCGPEREIREPERVA